MSIMQLVLVSLVQKIIIRMKPILSQRTQAMQSSELCMK